MIIHSLKCCGRASSRMVEQSRYNAAFLGSKVHSDINQAVYTLLEEYSLTISQSCQLHKSFPLIILCFNCITPGQ